MTKDDIIKLAKKVGLCIDKELQPELIVFSYLVANHEREECAKLAEQTICDKHIPTGVSIYGTRAAKAIRARGNT
jgi:hypothetical protein